MGAHLRKMGNSTGVIIPRAILTQIGVEAGMTSTYRLMTARSC